MTVTANLRRSAQFDAHTRPSGRSQEQSISLNSVAEKPITLLTGTSAGTWRDFATRVSTSSDGRISLLEASADHPAKQLRGNAKADVVIFSESPASLIADEASDAAATIDAWKTSASALLGLWRKNRRRAVILNWDECLADPAAFEKWLAGRLGRKPGKTARLPAVVERSVAKRVLADVIVARDHSATRLWNELLAASQPLSKKAAVHAQTNPELALAELSQQQKRSAVERHTLTARLSALESEHSSLLTESEALRSAHSSLVAERDALIAKLAESKQQYMDTSEMLLHNIQNAHKESEDFFEQLETARADCEATKQELAATRAAQASDKQERERTATLLQETRGANDELQSQLDVTRSELSALKHDSQGIKENGRRNHEMLLQELKESHKESENFFEQWKVLEASAGQIHIVAERVLRGSEKHHPPHNHLDYVFETVSLFERHWRRLPVRLVEHHGNAGIALFNPYENASNPLYHWEPTGKESGLDFMLFVPNDRQAVKRLVRAPASDLLLIRDATAKILGHLSVHEGLEADRWLPIARRLLQEIDEIPERLHYDSVAGFVNGEAEHRSIRFNAANLYFRGSCARAFVLDWTPATSGGTLRLKPSEADTLMLLSSASEVIVGFASAEEEESIRKLWPKLTKHDQAFLLHLAKALPDFVFHLCEQHPDQKSHQERLTKPARKLYRRLRSLDRRQKLRNAFTKLFRR